MKERVGWFLLRRPVLCVETLGVGLYEARKVVRQHYFASGRISNGADAVPVIT